MRGKLVLVTTVLTLTHLQAAPAQDLSAAALTRPGTGGPPDTVEIDIQFNLISIDERTESFEVEARLYASWNDYRLMFDDALGYQSFFGEAAAELLKGQIWWPYFEITDALAPREQMSLAVEIWPWGQVDYNEKFSVRITQGYDLSDFPWDAHEIQFSVESFRLGADEMVFVADTALGQWTFDFQEWQTYAASLSVDTGEDDGFSTATALVLVERNSWHYVSNIIIPLVLIIFIGSSVFWMNLETMHLGDRLSISLTSLLTVVAFDFVTSDGLPKLGYATALDYILTFAYVFSAVAIAENVRVSLLHGAGRAESAVRLDRIFRYAYPPGFLLVVVMIWLQAR